MEEMGYIKLNKEMKLTLWKKENCENKQTMKKVKYVSRERKSNI